MMHFRGLNLNLLVSLDALLTEKSVSRAAEKLHITQPAMSASLQRLRQYLSDPLLHQVGRKFELTPRALAMSMSVKELLLQIDALLNADQSFDPLTAKRTFRDRNSDAKDKSVKIRLDLGGHLIIKKKNQTK